MIGVYILRSINNGKYYIGSSDNIFRRLKEHNSGYGGSFTKINGPWRIVFHKTCESILEARLLEKKVQSYKSGNAFKKIINGEMAEWLKAHPC